MMNILKQLMLKLIPDFIKKAIIHEYKIDAYNNDLGFHQVSFSQQGEDLIITKYFGEKRNGFYVDVGAFHPVTYSNTHLLFRNGWKGINIDPNPATIALFKTIRPNDTNLQYAISAKEENLTYHVFNFGAINTLHPENAKDWDSREGFEIIDKVPVSTTSLKTVLQNHLPKEVTIDFMNIDAEGFDLQVLMSNDWSEFRPSLVMVEENIRSKQDFENSQIVSFMLSNNYLIYSICNGSIAFTDALSANSEKV